MLFVGRARVLLVLAPLGVTLWVLLIAGTVTVVLIAVGMARHAESVRADRRRQHVRDVLEPVFSRFLDTDDQDRLAEELRPAFLRMDGAERPVAAVLVTDLMTGATPSQIEHLRGAMEEAGIVELGERGTRRRSPWRRALACEMLGKVGAHRSVPALCARLRDRRPEVRMAAVQALGDVGSPEAIPDLAQAFLERRVAPTNVVNAAMRRIGVASRDVFEKGLVSSDPIVRVSSCFGLAGVADSGDDAVGLLARLLTSDPDFRVRTAAAAALGSLGGDDAPGPLLEATTEGGIHLRRAAVKALGSFDDPTTAATLDGCTEDEDRETAIRAAEALLALAGRPRAGPAARARLESSSAWAVAYVRTVAEVMA